MGSKIPNDINHKITLISESLFLSCVFLLSILIGLPGCANTDCGSQETCYPISSRVKKCFLFHHDKCSPHPYRSLEGYQTDLDKYVVKHAARKCANKSLKDLACNCKEKPSKTFRDGYRQAYIDIALGESGEVPPVPPEEYWAAHYRTPAGYQEIQEWFTGYKLGAEHALADGRNEYNKIATPYPLAGWDQPQADYWDENQNDYQNMIEPQANPQYAPTMPMSKPQQTLQTPNAILPPPPAAQMQQPARPIPQRSYPKPLQTAPQMKQPQTQPALPRQQIRNQPPLEAPKPPLHLQLPFPTAKSHQPPAYINDDPPPTPYSLQSYPYTPLPDSESLPDYHRSLNHTSTPYHLPRVPAGQPYGTRY